MEGDQASQHLSETQGLQAAGTRVYCLKLLGLG